MPSLTSIFNVKEAIDIALNMPATSDPIKDLVFGGAGKAVNSFVMPARYWKKTKQSVPMVYGSINAVPMQKTEITNVNYDIGMMWAKTSYDAEEMATWEQMTAKDASRELEVMIQTDGMDTKEDYVKNALATSITGELAVKTRVNANGTYDTFNINYGTVSTTARTSTSWASATKVVMLKDLKKNHKAIESQLKRKIKKSTIFHFASEEAYQNLERVIEGAQDNDVLKVKREEFQGYECISINGYKVFDIKGDYVDAEDQSDKQAVAANYIQAICVDPAMGNAFYYLKIKNKKLGFRPLPLGLVMVEYPDGTGFEVNFASRPMPIFNVASSTKMLVIS